MPSQFLGLDPKEVNHEAEKAFLLACALRTAELKQEKDNKIKSKRGK